MAGEYGRFEFGDETLMPRYYLADPQPTLDRRDNSKCKANQHQCVDIGFSGDCCPNDQYCYVDPESKSARCCPLERNCDEECGSTRYFCEQTATTTGSTTVTPACCPRVCTEQSFFRCEEDQGGACCPYDNACSGTVCVSTVKPTDPPLVTPVDEGCTTSQSRCEDGKGCCDVTRKCARVSGTAVCAPADFSAPGEVVDVAGGLSDGAKAGIGVGVAIAASAITAGLTWLYLRRRSRKRALAQDASPGEDEAGDVELTNTASPEPGRSGLTDLYVGPEAGAGPFTGEEPPPLDRRVTGVPAQPNAPDDIVPPVEIDSTGVTPVGEEREEPREDPRYELYGSDVPELASPPLGPGDSRGRSEVFDLGSAMVGDSGDRGKAVELESPVLGKDSRGQGEAGAGESPVLPEGSRDRAGGAGEDSPVLPAGASRGGREADVVSPIQEEESRDKDKADDGESPVLPRPGGSER